MVAPGSPGGGPAPHNRIMEKLGAGSGLNTASIVEDLVEAERAPTEKRLADRQERLQTEISALGQMRSVLGEFEEGVRGLDDPDNYAAIDGSSRDSGVADITVGDSALPGAHDVDVQQLAQSQRLATVPGVFESSSDPVGTGQLVIVLGDGREQTVTIGDDDATLLGIRDAINRQAEGVTASIVDDGAGPRLSLMTAESGEHNAVLGVDVRQGEDDSGDLYPFLFAVTDDDRGGEGVGGMRQIRAAQDAVATIDGLTVTRSENRIEDAIEGATLTLNDVGSTRVEIKEREGLIEERVQSFVEAYNVVRDQFNQLSHYNPETEESGPLQGDATLRGIEMRLSRAATEPLPALEGMPIQALTDIGIMTQRNGGLELDAARFQQAVAQHPDLVTQLFTDKEDGVAVRMQRLLDESRGADSAIGVRTSGLESQLERIEDDRERLDRRMEKVGERLRREFTAMDKAVAEFNQTSEFLEQRLAAMNRSD